MKILITGTRDLAQELAVAYSGHEVTNVSRSTGHDILKIDQWGVDFLDYDCVFNCAYDGLGQQLVLEYFYHHWQNDPSKCIVTIGSKVVTQPRSDLSLDNDYWEYRIHKQTLQNMYDTMWPKALCDLKIINPGAFDTPMVSGLSVPKINVFELAQRIKAFVKDPVNKRLDLWL